MPALFFAASLGFLFWARPALTPDPAPVLLRIPEGASTRKIASLLAEKGVIRSPEALLLLATATGRSRALHHGTYLLERGHYLKILRQLAEGRVHTVKVTIPEGWCAWQIGERLQALGAVEDAEAFLRAVRAQGAEGTLFPETYFFEPPTGATAAVAMMTAQFRKKFTPEMAGRAGELRLTEKEAVTLASIIEREAKRPEERPLISSVYHNRLKKRMPLEADPTVQYALSDGRFWKEGLTYKDLKAASPYNTYRHAGLPPGPICNPGLASLRAALHPARTAYLFFVADGQGGHRFFENYSSHIQGLREERQKRGTSAKSH